MAEKQNEKNINNYLIKKSSFIFLISVTSFFLSISFFLLNIEKFELTFAFIVIILITFAAYSFSIILVSLLIKYESDDTIGWETRIHISNVINLSRFIRNKEFLFRIEHLEEEIKLKKENIDFIPDFDKVDKNKIQSFKLKLAEGLYEHSLKREFLE